MNPNKTDRLCIKLIENLVLINSAERIYPIETEIPIAESWMNGEESDAVRLDVQRRFGMPPILQLELDPLLDLMLMV